MEHAAFEGTRGAAFPDSVETLGFLGWILELEGTENGIIENGYQGPKVSNFGLVPEKNCKKYWSICGFVGIVGVLYVFFLRIFIMGES